MAWRLFPGIYVPFLALALLGTAARGQDQEEAVKVRATAEDLLRFIADPVPKGFQGRFTETFLRAVDAAKLEQIFKSLAAHGKPVRIELKRMTGPYAGELEIVFDKGVRVPMSLTLEAAAPFQIVGIQFHHPIKEGDSWREVAAAIKELPGSAAVSLVRLEPDPRPLLEINAHQPMPVGSSFKLLVLAALAEEVELGRKSWRDTIPVRKEHCSLPAGLIQDWPAGSPVTLHTLATLMVSRSDNSASDHLVRALSRERIEQMERNLEIGDGQRNRPFLTTGELFKIKLVLKPDEQQAYLAANPDVRRAMLENQLKDTPLERPRVLSGPLLIDRIEWYYSTAELCRILDWLRRRPPEAREILGVNRGLSLDREEWPYVGYKGGSEPGVLNLSLLLKNRKGEWYALSLSWTNPRQNLDLTRLTGIAQRLIALIGKPPATPERAGPVDGGKEP